MKGHNDLKKIYIIVAAILLILTVGIILFSIKEKSKQYIVTNGTIEMSETVVGYVIKDETTIEKDNSLVLLPVISENSRVSKGEIIASYKGEEYRNYEETLLKYDKEILELMKDLPAVYSSEIDTIDNSIYLLLKESINEDSYNKIEEYKQRINSYINKKATIIGEMSPNGAKIKSLIQDRNDYENSQKSSKNNIKAPTGGLVIYSTDGLENSLTLKNVEKLNFDDIEKAVNGNTKKDNTKIKIVNNYEAAIVVRASLDYLNYIVEGYEYSLRLVDNKDITITGTITKVKKNEDSIDVYFSVSNNIEYLSNIRSAEFEVLWDYYTGFLVPLNAVNKYEDKDVYYVTAIKYMEYEKIPVKIRVKNEDYAIVKNYSDEELENIEIEDVYILKLHDRLLLNKK